MNHRDETPTIIIERSSPGIGSFLLGTLVGAGIALLLAPRTGEETRAEIRTGVRRLRERAEDTVRGVQDAVSHTLDNVKSNVGDRMDQARDAFEQGRVAARETRDDMERKVREGRERVRAGIEAARRPSASSGASTGGDENA